MWFSVTLWTVLASLVCSTAAYSSSHHSDFSDYEAAAPHKTGDVDPRWAPLEEDYEGKDPWSPSSADTETMSRRIFDGKASEAESALLADMEGSKVEKRESHSLSIVNPLDVLRQRLMLEMARRRMKENQDQIRENALILKNLGKRSAANMNNKGDARTNLRRIHVSNNEDFDV